MDKVAPYYNDLSPVNSMHNHKKIKKMLGVNVE